MAKKQVVIPHEKIKDTQKITQETKSAMAKQGLNIHVNEVSDIQDDFKTGNRILTVEKQGLMFHGYNITQDRWNEIFKKGSNNG